MKSVWKWPTRTSLPVLDHLRNLNRAPLRDKNGAATPDHGQELLALWGQANSADMTVILTVMCFVLLMPIAGLGWWVEPKITHLWNCSPKAHFENIVVSPLPSFCACFRAEFGAAARRRPPNGCWSLVNLFADNELALSTCPLMEIRMWDQVIQRNIVSTWPRSGQYQPESAMTTRRCAAFLEVTAPIPICNLERIGSQVWVGPTTVRTCYSRNLTTGLGLTQ